MSTTDPRKVLRAPGEICFGPTSTSTAFPHGGTSLGSVRGISFRPNMRSRPVIAEEFFGRPVDHIYAGDAAILVVILRSWDADAVGTLFPGGGTGTTTSRATWEVQSSISPVGALRSSQARAVMFSPRDTDEHPVFYMPRAIPLVEETADLRASLTEEMGLPLVFHAIPGGDETGRVFWAGMLRDLTL